MSKADEIDLLAAIWILASNDENHLITYRGISQRLNLDGIDPSRLITRRPELFRRGASASQLNEWKAEMRNGKHRPRWMKDLPTEDERLKAVESLSDADVFRSQFRAASDAPPSQIEIIDWGLKHLDRIRAADAGRKPDWIKRGTLIISLVTVLVGGSVAFLNYETTIAQLLLTGSCIITAAPQAQS